MDLTKLPLSIANPKDESKFTHTEFLIDSGAMYSAVPTETLAKLGIKPNRKEKFILMDGSVIERDMGDAMFQYKDKKGIAPVIFGKNKDQTILGIITLEVMGLGLNSLERSLIKLQPTL